MRQKVKQLVMSCELGVINYKNQLFLKSHKKCHSLYVKSQLILKLLSMDDENKDNLSILPKRKEGKLLAERTSNIKIITNYFPVSIKSFQRLYIFKVVFTPPLERDNRAKRLLLLNQAMPSIKQQIVNPVIGGMNIYSGTEPVKAEAEHAVQGYKILVKQVKFFSMESKTENKMLLHFLNNGIRNILSSLNFIEIGQTGKYFNQDQKISLFDSLSIYSGFKINFLVGKGGLFLRVDPTKKVVQNKTVMEHIDQIYKQAGGSTDQKRQRVKESLIGKIIMTNYGKTRYVRVEDVEFPILTQVMIPGDQKMNIIQYYQTKYDIQIKSSLTHKPLLRVQNKNKKDPNPVYILPQLCLMTGLPNDIDEGRRRKVSEATIKSPGQKYKEINDFVKEIKECVQQKQLTDLGIKIESKPHEIDGKVFNYPSINLGKGAKVPKGKQAFFSLFNDPIYDSRHELRVVILCFRKDSIGDCDTTIKQTGQKLGLKTVVNVIELRKSKSIEANVLQSVDYAIQKYKCNCALIILQSQMKNAYKGIKKQCLENSKIVSQVILESTLRKKNTMSIQTKVLLQMAAKVGNTLWVPSQPRELLGNTMLMSFDVSKSGGVRKVVGVATFDENMTRLVSQGCTLKESIDKFNCMAKIAINLVTRYTERNKRMPKHLIMMTNSCPRNEIKMYFDYFIPQLKTHLGEATKLTIIQAKDLSSERFFTRYSDGSVSNPNAGLLVRDSIVSTAYDFYLVSQKPTIGSTVPIHFNVISASEVMEQGILEQLMYAQCFNYANWSGSIKIPAIMQYAKKFARFSSEVLEHSNIDNQMLSYRPYFI